MLLTLSGDKRPCTGNLDKLEYWVITQPCNSTRANVMFYTWDATTADTSLSWESSPAERDLGVLVNRSQLEPAVCALANLNPECTKHNITSQSKQVIILLYLAPMWPLPKYCGYGPHNLKRALWYLNAFIGRHQNWEGAKISSEECLRSLGLCGLDRRRLRGDLTAPYSFMRWDRSMKWVATSAKGENMSSTGLSAQGPVPPLLALHCSQGLSIPLKWPGYSDSVSMWIFTLYIALGVGMPEVKARLLVSSAWTVHRVKSMGDSDTLSYQALTHFLTVRSLNF